MITRRQIIDGARSSTMTRLSMRGRKGGGTMRKPIAAALCSALCLAALGLMAPVPLAAAQQKAAKAGAAAEGAQGRKLSTIRDLMDSIVDPSADVLWGAVGTVVDQEGVHETFPKTQEEWL